ncbi:MAG: dihydrolipoyl dehydrogenase [Elusimicrobia bacterium RIFCSPLOWO2_01_FULL_59_12]|nr:MAG: dihydrolipoyl dehydrogenase [Elusimicrobia bacterium RIFCSPLOWO2_01_FULL_59_12]
MSSKSLIIIGGGPGGYAAALDAARRKLRVTLIDQQDIGGACLNRGCIPSKFFLSKSKRLADALHLADAGIQVRLEHIRLGPLIEQKNNLLSTLRQRMEQALKSASVERLTGQARFLSAHRVEIHASEKPPQQLEADAILLATGSTPLIPKTFPKSPVLFNSDSIFSLDRLPSHLVVLGGGYIGCELACAFQGLGSKVTLIEKEPRLLATQPEFEAAGAILQRAFEKRGMTVWTRTELKAVTPIDDQHLRLQCSNGETFEANALLLALGRAPNLGSLDIEKAGLALEKGRLIVNASMQTSVPSIYAIGDLVSPLPLAHVASREGEVAVAHLTGEKRSITYPDIPRCIYTWPEAASVGLTEEQAKQAGLNVRVDRYHWAASSKAMLEQETEGFWMILSDAATHKILGGLIVGPHATELIHLLALSLRAGLTARAVVDTVFAHPTLAEGFQEAMARSLTTRSITPGGRG